MYQIFSLAVGILTIVANWMIYQKMGLPGWKSIIPIYNTYILCKTLYGNGWKFLLLLIPLYNIYFLFKIDIDLAHRFGKSTGFGVGLVFLSVIFLSILAFGDAQYAIPSETQN